MGSRDYLRFEILELGFLVKLLEKVPKDKEKPDNFFVKSKFKESDIIKLFHKWISAMPLQNGP